MLHDRFAHIGRAIVAGSFFLVAGCTSQLPGLSQSPALDKDSQLIANQSASLIANQSASLIANQSASLASAGFSSLQGVLAETAGMKAAGQEGNLATRYRILAAEAEIPLIWSDSGVWPTPLATGDISGILSATRSGVEVERYAYAQQIRAISGDVPDEQTIDSFHRVEDVFKSLTRIVGRYETDQTFDPDNLMREIVTQDFHGEGLPVRHLGLTRTYDHEGVTIQLGGETASGAHASMSVYAGVNSQFVLRHTQHGQIQAPDGKLFALDVQLGGPIQPDRTLQATGSIDLTAVGKVATESVRLHIVFSQSSGEAPGTYGGMLYDGLGGEIAPLEHLREEGVFRAKLPGGTTQDYSFGVIRKILVFALEFLP